MLVDTQKLVAPEEFWLKSNILIHETHCHVKM